MQLDRLFVCIHQIVLLNPLFYKDQKFLTNFHVSEYLSYFLLTTTEPCAFQSLHHTGSSWCTVDIRKEVRVLVYGFHRLVVREKYCLLC